MVDAVFVVLLLLQVASEVPLSWFAITTLAVLVVISTHHHAQVLAALFGRMEHEEHPPLAEHGVPFPDSHPWLLQLHEDITSLAAFDDGVVFLFPVLTITIASLSLISIIVLSHVPGGIGGYPTNRVTGVSS